jgi:hypothetical protein
MRRLLTLTALPAAALAVAAVTTPSGAAADKTSAYGPFGFTTMGLGPGPQYGEPSLAVAPDGTHYAVSTPGDDGSNHGTAQVWWSANAGKTFTHTYFTSNNGGGDSALDFRPDGTLLGADLEALNTDSDSEIHISTDFGKTWTAQGSKAGSEQDRQWFAHTPDGKREFLVYHDFVAEAEFYVESDDGGKTWGTPQLVNDPSQAITAPGAAVAPAPGSPVSLLDQGVNTYSGPMMVANNGKDFYVVYSISNLESNSTTGSGVPPYGGVKGLVVAHSADAGKTWTNRYAVTVKPDVADPSKEASVGTMFPWGFLDQRGNVYVVYGSTAADPGGDHYGYYYVYSTDRGATWSAPKRIDGLGATQGSVVFNTGAAVSPGLIDVAWLQKDTSGIAEDNGTWSPWFAQISAATTAHPHIVKQRMTTVANHRGGVCIQGILCGIAPGSADRSLLDFFQLVVNPKTHLAAVAYADNGQFAPRAGKEVVFAQQTKQPKLPTTSSSGSTSGSSSATGSSGSSAGSGSSSGPSLAGTGSSLLIPVAGLVLLVAASGIALARRRRT